MTALPYVMVILVVLVMFSILIYGTAPSNVAKITAVVVMVLSFIGLGIGGYLQTIDMDQAVKQKNERLVYNEKKQEELITEKLKLSITDIL
ncbi:hypothetical protein P9Y49_26475, partial [Bacillus thuringiensis]